MEYIFPDQKVINEGRKDTLKDSEELQVTAPLRDQIPAKLMKTLKDQRIAAELVGMWYEANSRRAEWLERQKAYLDTWDEFLVSTNNGPYEGSSTLHMPMPLIVAKTMHARFLEALMGIEPPFMVKARTPANRDRAMVVQDVMNYCLKDWANEYKGVYDSIDKWVWDWVTTGSSVLKIRWDVKFESFVDVQEVPEIQTEIQIDEEGNEVAVPTQTMTEEEVTITEKVFEGPIFECINIEDIAVIGGGGDPQKADAIIHRSWLTASELWTLVDRKVFDRDAVEKIIAHGDNSVEGSMGSDLKQDRAYNSGEDKIDSYADLQRYEILEIYAKLDVNGSGINSEVVVWLNPVTYEICRATYLRRINKSGERPFFKADFHLRRDQEHGIGIVEMLYPLSVELDAMHNMRVDFGMLSTMPFAFYRPTSSIDPETISLEPGALIPVDNPQTDVYFPNLGNRTAFGMQEEATLMSMIERLTSISDLSLGIISSSQGAARTATGARAVIGEASANLNVHLRRLNLSWRQALRYLLHTLQQRLPEGLSFRLTKDTGSDFWYQELPKEAIAGDYDLELENNSSSSNPQIRIQNADIAAQLVNDPLAIQLGVVTPRQIYEAKKAQLQARGIKDVSAYIQEPQIPRMWTPQEMLDRVLSGRPMPVTPEMDHEGFIQLAQKILSTDEMLGQFTEQDTIRLVAQVQQHQQMLQALQQMAAQQRNMQQMNMNASQSAQQAPTGQLPQGQGDENV